VLKIYGCYRSRASRNFWLMNELGLAHDHVPVVQGYRLPDPSAPDAVLNTTSAAFLAINPAGTIPCIVDDGLILTESLAINLYLARKTGGTLAPAGLAEEALMLQWALFGATMIEQAALEIYYPYAEKRTETPEGKGQVGIAAAKLARPFRTLQAHLVANSHLVGGRFTVADLNLAEIVRYAAAHVPLMDDNPAVAAWYAACQARPGFKAMWAARMAEPA